MYVVLLRYFKDDPMRTEQPNPCVRNDSEYRKWAALASSYTRNDRLDDTINIWKDRLWESQITNSNDRQGKLLGLLREAATELTDGFREHSTEDIQSTKRTSWSISEDKVAIFQSQRARRHIPCPFDVADSMIGKATGPVANQLLQQYLEKCTLEPRGVALVYLAWAKAVNSASGIEAMAIHNQHMKGLSLVTSMHC